MKNIRVFFYLKICSFLVTVVKFSIYLNRRVFVMEFESAMVNELSVFESSKFYCTLQRIKKKNITLSISDPCRCKWLYGSVCITIFNKTLIYIIQNSLFLCHLCNSFFPNHPRVAVRVRRTGRGGSWKGDILLFHLFLPCQCLIFVSRIPILFLMFVNESCLIKSVYSRI